MVEDHMKKYKIQSLGIMQGRLSPPLKNKIQSFPLHNWQDEFSTAARCNLDFIEWIYDTDSEENNPLCTAGGLNAIREMIQKTSVRVESICADYFMDYSLASEVTQKKSIEKLEWLINKSFELEVKRLVIPFVKYLTDDIAKEITLFATAMKKVIYLAEKYNIELHLETVLKPPLFKELLDMLSHPLVKVNYDIGNSTMFGLDFSEEYALYGHRIGSVHIKDCKKFGNTVSLGTGDTDFIKYFKLFKTLPQQLPYIFQTARDDSISEEKLAKRNTDFIFGIFERITE